MLILTGKILEIAVFAKPDVTILTTVCVSAGATGIGVTASLSKCRRRDDVQTVVVNVGRNNVSTEVAAITLMLKTILFPEL